MWFEGVSVFMERTARKDLVACKGITIQLQMMSLRGVYLLHPGTFE